MSLNPVAGGQICPNCGAPNSTHAIFCAECGTSLTSNRDEDDQDNVGQTTLTFTPATDEPDPAATWDAANDSQATQEFTPQRQDSAGVDDYAASAWEHQDAYGAPPIDRPRESRRGFVLGMLASILIAIVIGFFIWSSVVSQGFRDSVTGVF